MHVWVLTAEYEPFIVGGLGVVASNLTSALFNNGIEISIFTLGNNYYKTRKYKLVKLYKENSSLEPPDLIHIHSLKFTDFAIESAEKLRVPIIYTCHSLIINEGESKNRDRYEIIQIKLLKYANKIIVPSEWQRAQLEQIYPFCKGKVSVIQNGIHIKNYHNNVTSSDHKRLLFVGRLIQEKGIEEVLQAIALIKEEVPDIKLDIIGKGSDDYLSKLNSMAENLQIKSNIRWLGYLSPDVLKYIYPLYGVVINPSKTESFGLVSLEALASGVPLISTQSGGLAEFINEDVAEIISDVNPLEITNSIRSLWNNKEKTNVNVKNGLEVASKYDWSNIAPRYIKVFKSMMKKGG